MCNLIVVDLDILLILIYSWNLYSNENICNINDESSPEEISNCLVKVNIYPIKTRDLNGESKSYSIKGNLKQISYNQWSMFWIFVRF